MKALECLENEAFNELINFHFDEVRAVFNFNKYFIAYDTSKEFTEEVLKVKNWYMSELDKIEKYAQGEYVKNKNSGLYIAEFEEPQYKISEIENRTKSKLIRILTKYFDKDLFLINKPFIYKEGSFKEEIVETPHEMLVALNVSKNRIYSLLSILGFYQRHNSYFLSKSAFLSICSNYSKQVYLVNKSLGMEYRFVNIFLGSERIKPPKTKKKANTVDESISEVVSNQRQSSKYIDIDKISLLMLLQPYLKHNTQEIRKIIEIMMENFNKYKGKDAWDKTMYDVNVLIAECESKGIMKRLAYYD